MTQSHLPQNWIQKLCVMLSIGDWIHGNFSHEAIRFFTAWAKAEGGTAEWNPLNTTDHIADAWGQWQGSDYNRITVSNFLHPWQGIAATGATILQSSSFDGILADLRADKYTAEQIVQRNTAEIKTWGTNPTLVLEVLKDVS